MTSPTKNNTDLRSLIDDGAFSRYQKFMLVLTAIAFLAEGVGAQSMGLAIPGLIKAWHVARGDFSWAIALGLIGFAIGAIIGGTLADRYGRRLVLVASVFTLAVGTIACGFTETLTQLSLFRVLAGLGLGGTIPTVTATIAEFTPARFRPVSMAVCVAFFPIGGYVAGEIAAEVLPVYGWTSVFWWDGGIALVSAILLAILLPESPSFLAGNINDASKSNAREALEKLLNRMGLMLAADAVFPAAAPNKLGTASRFFAQIKTPLKAAYRRDTMLLWLSFFFVVLGFYTTFSWIPAVLTGKGLSLAEASRGLSSVATGGIFGGLIGGWLAQRLGSRISFAILSLSWLGACIALIAVLGQTSMPMFWLSCSLALLGGTLSGAQTTLYAIGTNIYPPEMRTTGMGLGVGWGRIGAVLSSFTGVMSLDMGGAPLYFAVLGLAAVAAWIPLLFLSRHIRVGESAH